MIPCESVIVIVFMVACFLRRNSDPSIPLVFR